MAGCLGVVFIGNNPFSNEFVIIGAIGIVCVVNVGAVLVDSI